MSKKWLLRLKKKLINKKLRLDWDRVGRASVKTPFPVCTKHHSIVDMFMKCGLCMSKLHVGGVCSLGMTSQEVQTLNGLMQADGIPASLLEIMFVCKLCKTFCNIRHKAATQKDYLKNHTSHRAFYRNHKKR